MIEAYKRFEKITRKVRNFSTVVQSEAETVLHPFDERNIHPEIAKVTQPLFDDGHYSQAVFEGFKFLDKRVAKISKLNKTRFNLMMEAFNETSPKIHLTELLGMSEIDEQLGFRHIFAGSASGIRNPRGHEVGNSDTIEQCLDYLGLTSMLLRRLNARISP